MTMLKINDLKRHNAAILAELSAAASTVLDTGWYVLGQQVNSFELEFAAYCGASRCVSLANGSDAIELALRAAGVSAGDKVMTVANAAAYSTLAILATGAIPVLVDIDENTMLMSVDDFQQKLSSDIRAVMVTHLFGQVAPIREVIEAVDPYRIPVIEDCAQAHGAYTAGRKVGSIGTIGCFSFYPTKNLGALGDGGAIITSDDQIADRVIALKQYGWGAKYEIAHEGGRNSRLDELQAAFLRVKLKRLDNWNDKRREVSTRYVTEIGNPRVHLPTVSEGFVAHLFVIKTNERDSLRSHLTARQIATDIHYPVPDHQQPGLQAKLSRVTLPNTEATAKQVLTLPCFPEMTSSEITYVIDSVNAWSPN